MSPFTGDAVILEKVLGNDGKIWKEMSGPIQSIRIYDRIAAEPKSQTTKFTIEIKTDEAVVQRGPKSCVGVYRVEATWDFMALKKVVVKSLKLDCI